MSSNKVVWEQQFIVSEKETDECGVCRTSALFTAMQKAAEAHCTVLGCGRETLLAHRLVWMLSQVRLNMQRPVLLGENLCICTWAGENGRTTYPRSFEFFAENGKSIGMSASTWVLVDLGTRRLVLPRNTGILLPTESTRTCPLNAAERLRVKVENGKRFLRVLRSEEIDVNGHVNNARYLDWIEETFAEYSGQKKRIKEVFIRYSAEILPNAKVTLSCEERKDNFFLFGEIGEQMAFEATGRWTAL